MKEEQFDKHIRDLIGGYEETPAPEVWQGIRKRLDSGKRIRLVRKLSCALAAAAVLVSALMLSLDFRKEEAIRVVQTPLPESESLAVRQEPPISPQKKEPVSASVRKTALRKPDRPVPQAAKPQEKEVRKQQNRQKEVSQPRREQEPKRENRVRETLPETVESQSLLADLSETEKTGRGGRFSLSASGDFASANRSGNVNFHSPQYSQGINGTASGEGIIPISEPRHLFPISAGLELTYSFLHNRMAVGIGVNYTYLESRYEALLDNRDFQARVKQRLHYIGIPLNLYWNVLSTDRLFFYVSLGGMLEKPAGLSYDLVDLNGIRTVRRQKPMGVQWSTSLGLGFEYRFVNFMGIFLDPHLTYFFDCRQPYSVRMEQPFQFRLELGFRFHL